MVWAILLMIGWAGNMAAEEKLIVERINSSDFPKMRAIIQVERDGGTVKGLNKEQFRILADGLEIGAYNFSTFFSSRQWLAIALAVDISGSMAGEALQNARNGAIDFVSRTGVQDRLLLIAFGSQATEVIPATTEKEKLKQAVQNLQSGDNTALYDAIGLAAEKLAPLPSPKKNLVILTDGFDNSSSKTVAEIEKIVKDKKITVYAIGLGNAINEQILKSISENSQGKYFNAATPSELTAIYQTIAKEMQGSYCFEFTWPEEKVKIDGYAHNLEIKFSNQGNETTVKNQFLPANMILMSGNNSGPAQVTIKKKSTVKTGKSAGFQLQELFPHLFYGLLIGFFIALGIILFFKGTLLINLLIFILTEFLIAILLALWKIVQ